MTNLKLVLATGLASATLVLILTNLLGAQVLLQSPSAEPAHNLIMSLIIPLQELTSPLQENTGNSTPGRHGSQTPTQGVLANNVLGGQAGAAGGLAVIVLFGVSVLAAIAFIVSWKQRSFPIAGLLASSGIILMIPTLIATAYLAVVMIPGPILGFISGLTILGLGVIKGIRTAKTGVAAAR